jgi:hypothetical protein
MQKIENLRERVNRQNLEVEEVEKILLVYTI